MVGQLFVRYGLGPLEVAFLGNSWVDPRGGGESAFQDIGVGAKVRLAQGIGGRADLSLQGLITGPTGGESVTADEWIPTLVGLLDVGLTDRAGLSVNLAAQQGTGAVVDQLTATITPGLALTDRLSTYGGWAGVFNEVADTHWWEGGFAYQASPDMQLDLNAATSTDGDQWFVGFGMAVRTGVR